MYLARSSPTVLTWFHGRLLEWALTPPLWHAEAVGRPHRQAPFLASRRNSVAVATSARIAKPRASVIAAGHCTGWRVMTALCNAFGEDKLAPLAVGKRIKL